MIDARKAVRSVAALALLPLALGACGDTFDDLLEVRTPTQVLASELDDPAKAAFLVNSMIGTFYCSLGAYIQTQAELTDLLTNSGNNVIRAYYDARQLDQGLGHNADYGTALCDPTNGTSLGVYRPLQEVRWYADDLLAKLDGGWTAEQVGAQRDLLIARAATYAGFTTTYLGEGFCSAAFDGGPEVSRTEVFDRAEQRFTRAIAAAQAAGASDLLNAAYVGRARVRLNLGDYTGAAEDARLVPAGFQLLTNHESAVNFRKNIVAWQTVELQNGSVDEPYRNVTWQGVADPRVPVVNQTTPKNTWVQRKYPTVTTPIPIASYDEAQLIIAEAELEAGNVGTTVAIINQLHAAVGLPAYDGGTAAEVREHLIEERTRELFLEGHRLGDMLRYDIAFEPATGTPYAGVGGGVYGSTTCMQLPPVEYQNNTSINR